MFQGILREDPLLWIAVCAAHEQIRQRQHLDILAARFLGSGCQDLDERLLRLRELRQLKGLLASTEARILPLERAFFSIEMPSCELSSCHERFRKSPSLFENRSQHLVVILAQE